MLKKSLWVILIYLLSADYHAQTDKKIIYLSWENVVNISLKDNLTVKSRLLDYNAQNLEQWKAVSSFLPVFSYQGLAVRNLELPVFIFMGQQFVVGTNYSIQHSLDLTLPVFTGGTRWFNLSVQKSLKKSLSEELKGQESQTVLNALQAYYGIILSNELLKTADEAVKVAQENLTKVEKHYKAGTATELDLKRASAQYYSTIPQSEAAGSNLLMSYQRLKTILNIPLEDSLVVTDTLASKNFLKEYSEFSLKDLKELALEKRNDLKSITHKLDAVNTGEKIALGRFAPVISVSANISYQAQLDRAKVSWNDYIRSKSLALSVYWPIFEGGKKIVDYQIAQVRTDQMKLALSQAKDGASLDVEEKYYSFKEVIKSLKSLQQAMEQSEESMRISALMYGNGMSTQLDVLNAQLIYTRSKAEYLRGIFNYNVSQLQLLNSVGLMDEIWKSKSRGMQ